MSRHRLKYAPPLLLIATFAAGCATSEKIQVEQVGDQKLSCNQLLQEMQELDQAQREIDSKKGVTGTNVASAIFWLPGLAYTYYDAGKAEEMINGRKTHITGLYNVKNCGEEG